jgi:ATP-binding protein involved in chromosome partitioning
VALALSLEGRRSGLLDLDLTSPSAHVVLGFPTAFPTETFGLDPVVHHGVACLSLANFAPDTPAPLRGGEVSSAILEILAVTRWGDLDALVLDLPPGIGDPTLDALRYLPRAQWLVVAAAGRVVLESVRRTARFLVDQRQRVVGVLENMARGDDPGCADLARSLGTAFLGAVPFDEGLEAALGDPGRLARTGAFRAIAAMVLPALGAGAPPRNREEGASR